MDLAYSVMSGILLRPQGNGPFPDILISHGQGGNANYGKKMGQEFVKWGFACITTSYTHSSDDMAKAGGGKKGKDTKGSNYGGSEENIRRATKCIEILRSLPHVDSKRTVAFGICAAKIRTPFLIMHASVDRTVRPEMSQMLKEVLDQNQRPNERRVFEGEDHPVDDTKSKEVFELTRKWSTKYGALTDGQ